jgi:tRNA(Ile)-lysidine synthase
LVRLFNQFFSDHKINLNARFLVGVSGGIDSVVLADLCKKSGFTFAIAHCNFHLREEESIRDEKFVRDLARHYEVEVHVENYDTATFAEENKLSVQQAARDLRYDFFSRLCWEFDYDYTLLAHHADDNVETVLMNFFRGTGIKGLKGIPSMIRKDSLFLRPVLLARRYEIVQYARENHLVWAEDSSNDSIKYVRNYFRHEVLPIVRKVYPSAEENILQNAERFKRIDAFYSGAVEKAKKELAEFHEGIIRMPVKKLQALAHTSLVYEILSDYGFSEGQAGEFLKLLEAGSGKFIENEKFQLIRHDKWIIFSEKKYTSSIFTFNEGDREVEFPPGSLSQQKMDISELRMDPSPDVALLDARHIEYPMILRKWKEGDYFYPLGMPKKKKLARFLIDLKFPKNKKEEVWVLESDKKILWIVGLRIDHRVRIQASTLQLIKITFKRKDRSH